jgi:hypothetical protein
MFKAISRFLQVHCNKRTQPNHYRNLIVKSLLGFGFKSIVAAAGTSVLPLATVGIGTVMISHLIAGVIDQDGIFEQYLSNGISSSVGMLVGFIC